jgi:outer membrane protein
MKLQGLIVAVLVALSGAQASAADSVSKPKRKTLPIASTETWSPWMIRVRAVAVLPDTAGSTVNVFGAPFFSSPSSGLSIGNVGLPEIDLTYFFNRNFAVEMIPGLIPQHITGVGTLSGLDIGRDWAFAPTVMLQYHCTDFGTFQPYVGAGPTYAAFFDEKPANTVNSGMTVTALNIKNNFGVGAQAGFDYMLDRHWGLNVDIKKFYLQVGYNAITSFGPFNLPVTGTARINPLLAGAGASYKF